MNKDLKAQLDRLREESQTSQKKATELEQTFQRVLAKFSEKPAPNFETDPLGALKHENETLKAQMQAITGTQQQTAQQMQNQVDFTRLSQAVTASEATFRTQHPDYDAAIAHLKQVRYTDFTELGYSDAQAAQMVSQESVGFVATALQQGKSPAEAAYKMSQRYGYKAAAGKENGKEKIATIAAGQEAAKGVGGGRPASDLTLEAVTELTDEQIDELIKNDALWKKTVGGGK